MIIVVINFQNCYLISENIFLYFNNEHSTCGQLFFNRSIGQYLLLRPQAVTLYTKKKKKNYKLKTETKFIIVHNLFSLFRNYFYLYYLQALHE